MFGYKDRFDYYSKVTVAEHSHKIKVPTFAVDALDDQVVSTKAAPIKVALSSESNLCLAMSDYGAHACHM